MMEHSSGTYAKLGVFIAIFVAGFVGNLLTIIVICRKRRRKSVYQMLVLNLAISDFLFIVIALPIYSYELFKDFPKSAFYCRVVWPGITILYFLSIFSITAMALQRCRTVVKPYRQKFGRKTAYLCIAAIWFSSFIIVLPLSVVTEKLSPEECIEKWPSFAHRQAYTAALFTLQYLLPLVIIAIAYAKIALYLLRRAPSSSGRSSTREQQVSEARRMRKRKQAIRTLAAVVLLFALCMFPGQIAWMMLDFGSGGENQRIAMNVLIEVSGVLDNFHACLNPIIYCLLNEQYRREYIKLFYLIRGEQPN